MPPYYSRVSRRQRQWVKKMTMELMYELMVRSFTGGSASTHAMRYQYEEDESEAVTVWLEMKRRIDMDDASQYVYSRLGYELCEYLDVLIAGEVLSLRERRVMSIAILSVMCLFLRESGDQCYQFIYYELGPFAPLVDEINNRVHATEIKEYLEQFEDFLPSFEGMGQQRPECVSSSEDCQEK